MFCVRLRKSRMELATVRVEKIVLRGRIRAEQVENQQTEGCSLSRTAGMDDPAGIVHPRSSGSGRRFMEGGYVFVRSRARTNIINQSEQSFRVCT